MCSASPLGKNLLWNRPRLASVPSEAPRLTFDPTFHNILVEKGWLRWNLYPTTYDLRSFSVARRLYGLDFPLGAVCEEVGGNGCPELTDG